MEFTRTGVLDQLVDRVGMGLHLTTGGGYGESFQSGSEKSEANRDSLQKNRHQDSRARVHSRIRRSCPQYHRTGRRYSNIR